MKKEYITAESLEVLLSDIRQNMESGNLEECTHLLIKSVDSLEQPQQAEKGKEIDRAYIGNLREKKRTFQIKDVWRMLKEMTPQQVENVHKYVSDEYIEPNHEAEALEAILQISRKHKAETARR